MSNQIILGKKGCGKLINFVSPAIRLHHGPVLWISTSDKVSSIHLENVIDGNIKIQVVIDKQHSIYEFQKLKRKLHQLLCNKQALVIFEDAASTFNDLFCEEAKKIISSSCNHMFVFKSENEMLELFTNRMICELHYEIIFADESLKDI